MLLADSNLNNKQFIYVRSEKEIYVPEIQQDFPVMFKQTKSIFRTNMLIVIANKKTIFLNKHLMKRLFDSDDYKDHKENINFAVIFFENNASMQVIDEKVLDLFDVTDTSKINKFMFKIVVPTILDEIFKSYSHKVSLFKLKNKEPKLLEIAEKNIVLEYISV